MNEPLLWVTILILSRPWKEGQMTRRINVSYDSVVLRLDCCFQLDPRRLPMLHHHHATPVHFSGIIHCVLV